MMSGLKKKTPLMSRLRRHLLQEDIFQPGLRGRALTSREQRALVSSAPLPAPGERGPARGRHKPPAQPGSARDAGPLARSLARCSVALETAL